MAFPSSPANNATTTVNGIGYVYSSSTNSWTRAVSPIGNLSVTGTILIGDGIFWSGNGDPYSSGGGGGIGSGTLTASTSPPASPNVTDQWYDTATDILYEYINDGISEYWIDVQSPIFNGSLSTNLVGNLSITGNLTVARAFSATGNITTRANLNVLQNANIYGDISGANLFLTGNSTVSSNLTVLGNTIVANIISNNISNTGTITNTGNISTNNISVTNNISTQNIATGNLTITGNVSGNLNLTGNITADNLVSTDLLTGNIIATSSLVSTGNVSLTGANVYLGNVGNLSIAGGTNGQFLQTDGNGELIWQDLPLTSIQEFTATGGQTVFTIVGTYTVGTVLVFVNGIQMNTVDYTATSGTTVVLTQARMAGDTVRIFSSVGASSLSSGLVLSITNVKNFAVAMSVAMGM